MTRTRFIIGYAARSSISHKWADLGFIEFGDHRVLVALPCGCGNDKCQGWAMVSPANIPDHLEMYTPEPLRSAYLETVNK